ncbi:DivIVA domain-containing protein [Microbacterium sp. GXF7504]
MSDVPTAAGSDDERNGSPFDQLMQSAPEPTEAHHTSFTVGFRGYDKQEVDAAIADLNARIQQGGAEVAELDERHRRELEQLREEQNAVVDQLRAEHDEALQRLAAELSAARAQAADAEQQVSTLTAQLVDAPARPEDDPQTRQQFEAVLRVAEEQASVLVQNAAAQAERMLEAAREEVATQRAAAEADAARLKAEAQHDADQVRLRMETEFAAHEARIQREAAHAAEKVAQAEQEAAAVRTEAEKGAAALRAMVTRETAQLRADAERDVREMNARVLEFEETLTRRQDDAQQEFLLLHNQAVSHAERITTDANEQVAASLEHAQRISAKADDYERLMRAQAAQIEADAQVRARETLDRARVKAQKIVDTVIGHTTGVLRDAEDRTRQLRWQQQQLGSFMAEVRELIRPEGVPADAEQSDAAQSDTVQSDAADARQED